MQPPGEPTLLRILDSLKTTRESFVSGSALAASLRLSRTGIWKHIQALRARGYQIESHPKQGYRLTDTPDLLIPEEVLPGLQTRWLAHRYHHLDQTTSTNDHAMTLALQGAPHGSLIVAEQQTQGRGRLRRPWISARHQGIYLSIILRGPLPFDRAPQVTMVAALSLSRCLRTEWGVEAFTKWPNDVLVQGRKVAGILTEAKSDQDQVHFLVLGVGININQSRKDLSESFRYPATSLALELGHTVKRQDFLNSYIHRLEPDYDRWKREGFAVFSDEWENTSWILNKTITLQCSGGAVTGRVIGFSPEGALRLLQHNGTEQVIWAGDVERVEGLQ
jgi:BirA family biotin operon repressor/biotin-[acetyl-CoA-carboxylase] ligase